MFFLYEAIHDKIVTQILTCQLASKGDGDGSLGKESIVSECSSVDAFDGSKMTKAQKNEDGPKEVSFGCVVKAEAQESS